MNDKPTTVDAYIAGFPAPIQELLQQIRTTIHEAAPDAQETIKYAIPTFTLNGNLVSFAAYKTHIGLYPLATGDDEFNAQLARYKAAKSSAHFPLDEPLPLPLIRELVRLRVAELAAKSKKNRAR